MCSVYVVYLNRKDHGLRVTLNTFIYRSLCSDSLRAAAVFYFLYNNNNNMNTTTEHGCAVQVGGETREGDFIIKKGTINESAVYRMRMYNIYYIDKINRPSIMHRCLQRKIMRTIGYILYYIIYIHIKEYISIFGTRVYYIPFKNHKNEIAKGTRTMRLIDNDDTTPSARCNTGK